MKTTMLISVWMLITLLTFGYVAANADICDSKTYDPSTCRAKTGMGAAMWWLFYWTWAAFDAIK
jgi:hypothetical protein